MLDSIASTTRIYEAWSDEGWVNDGAAVRVSLVAFGHASQDAVLDGKGVSAVHSDLTATQIDASSTDLTLACRIDNNKNACFVGTSKKASFDIPGQIARTWLIQPNPHGIGNSQVVKPWINGSDLVRASSDTWIVDFGVTCTEGDAALFEAPFEYVSRIVKVEKAAVRNEAERRKWWLHARTAPDMRNALSQIPRFLATSIGAKHRLWVWRPTVVLASHAVCVAARADDATFGILHSRFHEIWSLGMCTWLGVGNDPRYTPTTCFETFPFPAGLTPADTAHQRTEVLPSGAVIPAEISEQNTPFRHTSKGLSATTNRAKASLKPSKTKAGVGLGSGAILKSAAYEPLATAPLPTGTAQKGSPLTNRAEKTTKQLATDIANAAKQLNDKREAWLNPPEWTVRVPEVTPLGMDKSPYPDRILPKNGHEKDLAERTLTKLYNQRPAWLDGAHKPLDLAVAAAYGWPDYAADMPDEEILKRLLALNLERSQAITLHRSPAANEASTTRKPPSP